MNVQLARKRGSRRKTDIIVVIAAYDKYRRIFRDLLYAAVKYLFSLRRRRICVENIARDNHKLDFFSITDVAYFRKNSAVLVVPLPSHKFFTDMPIGRVQYFHSKP